MSRLGQVKISPLSASLLSFSQKGYLTRTKPFNGLKLAGDDILFFAVVKDEDVPKLTMSLKRNSGGRVSKVDFASMNQQGASGSGTNVLKITKKGDFATITSTNIGDYALAVSSS